jgi:uncharacterized membrane protein YfcA
MDSALALSLLLSAGIGLSLGVFGGGGSILAVPMLVLVTQLAPAAAVGTSLAMVGATSLLASYAHYRQGHVVPKVALLFGLSGVLTAFIGAKLTALVSGSVIMHAFAVLMLVVGVAMLFGGGRGVGATSPSSAAAPRLSASILAGAGVGFITGFLGVGGGFLVVPALVAFAGLDVRQAVGTSLLVIAINSAAGLAGHLTAGQLDFSLIGALTTVAVAGAVSGERVTRQVSTIKLRRGFGLLVIVVGLAVTIASTLSATGLRSHAQLLRGTAQPRAANRSAERGSRLAAPAQHTGMRHSLHSATVEAAQWPA